MGVRSVCSLDPNTLGVIANGLQAAIGHTEVNVPLPVAPALRGAVFALQALSISARTAMSQRSDPTVITVD